MEVGMHPGINHLHAIKKIDEVRAQGGKVKESYSHRRSQSGQVGR